jgi:hypothetical protein
LPRQGLARTRHCHLNGKGVEQSNDNDNDKGEERGEVPRA